jgi:flagellar FliJ protein
MARFRFGLQPVLEHRERIENERQHVLAVAQREFAEAESERERLLRELAACSDDVRSRHRELDGPALQNAYAYAHALSARLEVLHARVETCAALVARAQRDVIAASRDRQVLETLKTRRRDAHNAELDLATARELDDANARAFGRKETRP